MRVKDAMSTDLLVVGTVDTVAEAAHLMLRRRVGAAIVVDESIPGPGIITERDVMRAVADGRDPEATPVEACMTFEARTATTNWDLDTAAEEMLNGHFRHLLVVDEKGRMVGIDARHRGCVHPCRARVRSACRGCYPSLLVRLPASP